MTRGRSKQENAERVIWFFLKPGEGEMMKNESWVKLFLKREC